jgi:hypothetical protein
MTNNSLFLDHLYETNLLSKSDKNDIIFSIFKNHSKSDEIMDILNKSKFESELSAINKAKNITLYNNFTKEFKKLNKIMTDLYNESENYECGDIDRVISDIMSLCKEEYINYTNDDGETILFFLLREYYQNRALKKVGFSGCRHSLMSIFDSIILNKHFDIDIKNKDGIDAYRLCKDLGEFDDSNDENDDFDQNEYDPCEIICKMAYRRKLNKKNKQKLNSK